MYNHYYEHQGIAYLAIPGCGSESLANGVHITLDAAKFKVVRAFIRDPIERLRSKYQFFYQYPQDPRHAPTWEARVDRVLDQQKGADYRDQPKQNGRILTEPRKFVVDPHWIPQADILDEAPVEVTELIAFENFAKTLVDIAHLHQSKRLVVDLNYRRAELDAYYARDLSLRRGL